MTQRQEERKNDFSTIFFLSLFPPAALFAKWTCCSCKTRMYKASNFYSLDTSDNTHQAFKMTLGSIIDNIYYNKKLFKFTCWSWCFVYEPKKKSLQTWQLNKTADKTTTPDAVQLLLLEFEALFLIIYLPLFSSLK